MFPTLLPKLQTKQFVLESIQRVWHHFPLLDGKLQPKQQSHCAPVFIVVFREYVLTFADT